MRKWLPMLAGVFWVAGVVGLGYGITNETILAGPALVPVPFGLVGVLLGVRRPTHPIGWLLLGVGAGPALTAVCAALIPGFDYSAELQNGLLVGGLAVVLVLFPTGSVPARWWSVPMVAVMVSWVGLTQFGVITLGGGFELSVGVVLAAVSLVVCLAAPIVRFRRATGMERSQLRWLGAAAGLTAVALVLSGIGLALDFKALVGLVAPLAALGAMIGLPASILVAVLRYRLYDIERIVSRSVTYIVVAILVSAVYAIPVLLAPAILGSSNDLVTAMATLTAAVAFSPLRRRVRRVVDRRFNRSAYDAAREVERFADGVRDEVDPHKITDRLGAVVRSTLHPTSVAVWLHPEG
ncbi:MAG: hypothetical protein HZA58_04530 [Acidimicrobiia bacterium]|nr:hypothetical protein [Acidimicrobiia bacterium]